MSAVLRCSSVLALVLLAAWGQRPPVAQAQQRAPADERSETTVRGLVTDAATGQPLAGTNVALLEPVPGDSTLRVVRGTATNADGLYQLVDVARGRYLLRVSYVGYVPSVDTLTLGTEALLQQNVALRPADAALDEVVVTEDDAGAAQLEAGLQKIRPSDLERIPAPGVGGDLAMYLQSVPGIVSLGDRGGDLFIRGGTPDQNLVLMDKTIMYKPFHIIGFFSAFPQELVQSTDLYAGGFGAKYSGRISSVIDVTMRPGNKKTAAGGAQVGPFLTGVRFEGPIANDGALSAIGTIRRSVIEETSPTVLGRKQPLHFSDAYFKLHNQGQTSSCGLTAMRTYDRGRIAPEDDDAFRWSNTTVGARCLSLSPRSAGTVDINLGFSHHNNEIGSADEAERSASVWRFHTNVDATLPLGPEAGINWGFRGRYTGLNYQLGERFTGLRAASERRITAVGYAGADVTLGERLDLAPSVAVTMPFDEYAPSIEPRLRATWRPFGAEAQKLNGALGLYRQTMVGISDERDAGSVFRAWLPAPLGGSGAQALHAILGGQQRLHQTLLGLNALDVSVEGYYKRLWDLPVPLWSALARFTTELELADGDVYGIDVRTEFQDGPVYGYLGYGFSWTKYRFGQDIFSQRYSAPVQRYHPAHDRRHVLNAALSADLGSWTTSLRWQLGSGRPYTRPFGFDKLVDMSGIPPVEERVGTPRILYERPYQGRLPTYHRLDVSVKRTFDLGPVDVTAEGGAINLYDRANLFYYDLFTLRRVDQLPLVPYLSLKVATQ